MYVCVCNGVTERQIRQEVAAGARRLEDLQDRLSVATCCGQCRDYALELLERELAGRLAVAV
ncbi:MAG: hypothetical protein KatS3mg124_0006 [Porticoccaceae bacterium]|nr:MAG: hypothetical protein KatS3mg124_0006 [Porticoccaceae bacterium]